MGSEGYLKCSHLRKIKTPSWVFKIEIWNDKEISRNSDKFSDLGFRHILETRFISNCRVAVLKRIR